MSEHYKNQFAPMRHDYPPIINAWAGGRLVDISADKLNLARSDLRASNLKAWRSTVNIIERFEKTISN